MASYDYKCVACGHVEEIRHAFNETPDTTCPACGAAGMRKQYTRMTVAFKGEGWASKE